MNFIFIFAGKRYTCIEVTAMLCMCVGLILFTLADSSVSPSFDTYGMYHGLLVLLYKSIVKCILSRYYIYCLKLM